MTEQPAIPKDTSIIEWRMGSVEKQIGELVTRSEGWHSSLGAQITSLSNQIGTTLAALPSLYSPRPEAEERHRSIAERFEDVDRRFADHGHDAIAKELKAIEQRINDRAAAVDGRIDTLGKTFDEQIKVNRANIDRLFQMLWGAALGMLMLTIGVLFAIFRSGAVGGGA